MNLEKLVLFCLHKGGFGGRGSDGGSGGGKSINRNNSDSFCMFKLDKDRPSSGSEPAKISVCRSGGVPACMCICVRACVCACACSVKCMSVP